MQVLTETRPQRCSGREGMYLAGQRATGKFRAPGVGEETEMGLGKETMEQRHVKKIRSLI